MGEVYQTYDELLHSDVALKTLLPKFGADPAMLERFRREVLLARKASHPNVCRVYHLDSTQTSAGEALDFLTMEFLEGETLSERLKHQGRMSPAEVMPLLRQVAAGLDAAHAEGVVHRDFKTSNVMLVPRQAGDAHSGELRAVVTDFGIARALQSQGGLEEQVTGTGLLGTPEYMAPEQVSGGEVGPAADIYALGLVLYEMLTGSLPFAGATRLEVAVKRVNERPPPPRSVVPELDLRWNAAVLKCLERETEARFSTAADVVRFLDRPAPLVSRRKVLTVALVGLAVVVLMFRRAVPPAPSGVIAPEQTSAAQAPTGAGPSETTLPEGAEAAPAADRPANGPVTQERQPDLAPGPQKKPKSSNDHIREIDKLLERQLGKASTASAYDWAIELAIRDPVVAGLYPIPPALVKAIIRRESNFNPRARSRLGAIGLMQLMPINAEKVGLTETDLWIPEKNILGGTRLLAALLSYYKGNIPAALVAYNAKPQNPSDEVPNNGETREYVAAVLQYYDEYTRPGALPRPSPR